MTSTLDPKSNHLRWSVAERRSKLGVLASPKTSVQIPYTLFAKSTCFCVILISETSDEQVIMSPSKSAPVEIDPKIAALILAGVVSEIRDGKVHVICAEKIDFRGIRH